MSTIIKILTTISLIFVSGFVCAQKFYEAENIENAKVKFYIASSPEKADLHFCIIYDAKEINKPGVMMEVETPKEADIIIIFVDDEKDADIKVWLVEIPAEVKWVNEEKKQLLSVGGLK